MSKTIALHVRYKSLYISLPSSAKPEREMTKFCIVRAWTTTAANFSYIHLEMNAVVAYLAIFSLILEPLANRTELENGKFRR